MDLALDKEMEKMVGGLALSSLNQMEPEKAELSDWHKQRLGKFTSSRIGDLMKQGRKKGEIWGKVAESYIYEKVSELLTGLPKETPETFAMAWGTKYEAEAIEKYNEISKQKATPMGTVFIPFNEICGGSPDGFVGKDGIIEVKCPNSHNHFETFITENIKPEYIYQCQGNMLFSGRQWCDFISYDPRFQQDDLRIKVIRIERNEEMCDAILERIQLATEKVLEIKEQYNLDFKVAF